MNKRFILKEGSNPNYLATVCRIGETFPIEGADRIQKTVINGYDMVIPKTITEGTVVVYFPVESVICDEYLSTNNLYEIGEYGMNSNAAEVSVLLSEAGSLKNEGKIKESEEKMAEAKSLVGFFGKRGRVRILKLKGISSSGFIAGIDSFVKFMPSLADVNWDELVGTQFNYIDDKEICWKYVAPIKEQPEHLSGKQKFWKKRMKKLNRFDRIIPDTFEYHYDTTKLNEHIHELSPENMVTITVKLHGTSIILANIPVNKKLSWLEKIKKWLGIKVVDVEYGNVYSSRSVIKNQYINPNAQSFYESDIWGCVNRDFSPYIDKDMTIYGEVVGYIEGKETMIQKDHDYGCKVGEWKFMPYRISTNRGGQRFEWNVEDVYDWTMRLIKEHPELKDKVIPINILYHGKLSDLYPDIDTETHWHENLLARMKTDTELFGMELKEPMCHLYESEANAAKKILDLAVANGESKKAIAKLQKEYDKWENMRAPREGVVIRVDNDPKSEAWKLKCDAHYHREAKQHDNGEVDMEENA